MIVNPYTEVVSLHDMNISSIEINGDKVYVYLDQAFLFTGNEDYILDNPMIIIHDIIDVEDNKDYPIRIKLIADDEVYTPTLIDFNKFSFNILEEAYGFGLVHFYGIVTSFEGDVEASYDGFIDIHYCGDLELKWDDKKLVEV